MYAKDPEKDAARAQRIKALRLKKAVSQKTAAAEMGVAEGVLREAETTGQIRTMAARDKMAAYYNVPELWLEHGVGPATVRGGAFQIPPVTTPAAGVSAPAADQVFGATKRHDTGAGEVDVTVFETPATGHQEAAYAASVVALRQIYDSGDQAIVRAVEANIAAFRRGAVCAIELADVRRQNEALKDRLSAVEDRLRALERGRADD